MVHEALRDSTLVRTVHDVFADLTDLIQKEIRLARAEVTHTVTEAIQAGVWMAVAGILGFVAALFLQAIVFGIASLGIGVGWASLIVAVALAAAAAGAFFYGRSRVKDLQPKRTIRQINEDIGAVREQLT